MRVLKGLRTDKKVLDIMRESTSPIKIKYSKVKKMTATSITHPDKILYPEDKITKQQIYDYYDQISQFILPFISSRPLTLVRCPENYQETFYQKHPNKTIPLGLYPIDIKDKHKIEQYIYLTSKEGLLSLVQMSVLEIHPWGSKISNLEHPDMITFDLDPAPDVPWKKVVQAAFEVKKHLEEFNLKPFVKTTGGKGLHVVVPILPEYDWEKVKNFTHVFVNFLEQKNPKRYISKMSKAKRVGKIFIDYLRNARGATSVSAYSTRARLHAPVSTPLAWDELTSNFADTFFTIKTLPLRLEKLASDPWKNFWKIRQSLHLYS